MNGPSLSLFPYLARDLGSVLQCSFDIAVSFYITQCAGGVCRHFSYRSYLWIIRLVLATRLLHFFVQQQKYKTDEKTGRMMEIQNGITSTGSSPCGVPNASSKWNLQLSTNWRSDMNRPNPRGSTFFCFKTSLVSNFLRVAKPNPFIISRNSALRRKFMNNLAVSGAWVDEKIAPVWGHAM
jgi:hypothetical protein